MISLEKQILRGRAVERLRAMTAGERMERSAAIAGHLSSVLGMVFGFAPLPTEPAWFVRASGRVIALPRVEGAGLVFHRTEGLDGLVGGAFGVREPRGREATRVATEEADAVLVPGLAFDREGGRLGRGGGFYDRFLAEPALRARRIAVAFRCQMVGRVPVEPHDARVDAIVTEEGWIAGRNSGRGRG